MFVLVSLSYLSLKSELLNRWLCVHHVARHTPWVSRWFPRRLLCSSRIRRSVSHRLGYSQLVVVVSAEHDSVFKDASWRDRGSFFLNINSVGSDTLARWHVSHNIYWLFSSKAGVGVAAVNLRRMSIGLWVLMRLVAWSRRRRILLITLQTLIVNSVPESEMVVSKDSIFTSFLFMAAEFSIFCRWHDDLSSHWATMPLDIFFLVGLLLIIYIFIVTLVFIPMRLFLLLLVSFFLIVAIDYLRNTNSIVVIIFLL